MKGGALWGASVTTQITPSFGPTSGGNTVDIIGSGLTGATSVTFDSQSVVPTVISDSQLNVLAPSHVPGMVNVSVTTASGTSLPTSASAYVYQGDWIVYVTNINTDNLTPIDVATNTPETPITLGNLLPVSMPFGIAITPDGKTAYVTI